MNSETKKQIHEVEYARTIYFTIRFPSGYKHSWDALRRIGSGINTNHLVNGHFPYENHPEITEDSLRLVDICEDTDLRVVDGEYV